jgi:hypothetical protein
MAAPSPAVYIGPDVPVDKSAPSTLDKQQLQTDADRLREKYREVGEAQNHKFGEGTPGSTPPNFNLSNKPAVPKTAEGAPETVKPEPVKPAPVKPLL